MVDVLVLGSGVAGLSTAVHAARLGLRVAVVTKGELAHSATRYAQGGVAAAVEMPDSPRLHLDDTLAAGAGLCDADAVEVMVNEGPMRVRELVAFGAEFDQTDGELALAREGGHSVARILHAGGDATGKEIERALVHAVRETAADVLEGWFATDLVVERGRVRGVRGFDAAGALTEVTSNHVVIATGGAGQLFDVTTNPVLSTGDGIAMARRAGAAIADVEFMQFHPTALHHPSMPRPLLSEALRGEGAVLRDDKGVAFMVDEHAMGDLAPRDVVARAITIRLHDRGVDHLWLDATPVDAFPTRFPSIWRTCRAIGLDPRREWLPVAPAAHYLSGGVCADLDGATTIPGLWVVGEAACSGVHGANRLASNSLLDGLVYGPRAAMAIARGKDTPSQTGVLRGAPLVQAPLPLPEPGSGEADVIERRGALQRTMTLDAGVLRDEASLTRASKTIDTIASSIPSDHDPKTQELRNLATTAAALITAASARIESRGTHNRLDFPQTDPALVGRFFALGAGPLIFAPLAQRTAA
jgi:L-aspartate oxidase